MKFGAMIYTIFNLSTTFALSYNRILPRPDIRRMSSEKLNRHINAVKKFNFGPRSTVWDTFARKHVEHYNKIHSNPQFLAWHRIFLHEVEEKLREIDDEVRIPYWDWIVHNSNMNEDPIWKILDKTGDSSDKYVRNGVFNDFRVLYGDSPNKRGRCIKRKDKFASSFGDDKESVNDLVDSQDMNFFAVCLEGVPHTLIHNGIGEEFQGHASPGDPLFFSHYAFIDKIWFDLQNKHSETALTYHFKDRTKVVGYNKEVWQAYDPFIMCYAYLEYNFSWTANINTRIRSASINISEVEPYAPLISSNLTHLATPTDEERQENARKYILEGVIAPDVSGCPSHGLNGKPTIPFGEILDIKYINKMGYSEIENRKMQHWNALGISEKNKNILS